MDDIIGTIREAEESAAKTKAAAAERATQILQTAERTAAEIAAQSETDCRTLRERTIQAAQALAQKEYAEAVAAETLRAKAYADEKLEETKAFSDAVVRRILP